MRSKKIKYAVALLFYLQLFAGSLPAQNLPRETIVTHLSEQYLMAGENLMFSVMVTNQEELPGKQISNLAFVEFMNASNQSLIRKKILLNDGIGSGMISLDDSLSSGMYYFVVYTSWMKNFGQQNFSVSKLLVVNPGDNFTAEGKGVGKEFKEKVQPEKPENFSLSLNKQSFSNCEKVTAEVNLTAEIDGAVFSVAVRKKEPSGSGNFKLQSVFTSQIGNIKYLPDYRGLLLTGFVRNKLNNQPLSNQAVYLSFPGEDVEIKRTITEDDGRFRFLLKPATGEKDMVFFTDSENAGIWLEERFTDSLNVAAADDSLRLNEKQVSFFTEKFINNQLQKRFGQFGIAADTTFYPEENYCFYDDPYQVLKLEEYIQLDSIREYFYELIPTVRLSRKNKNYTMRLSNPATHYAVGDNPALFIDGVYYPYPGELMKTDVNKIDRIEVIPEVYYYRDMTFDGIVSVFTKDADFMDIPLMSNMTRVFYKLAEPNKSFSTTPAKSGSSSNLPDLRWLIYWHPEIRIERGKPTSIEFITSDLKGNFEITVTGITERGEIIQLQETFVVE